MSAPTVTLAAIRTWRAQEHAAGRPDGLRDYFAAHGLCFGCKGRGDRIVGWGLGTANPIIGTCADCGGSGRTH